MGGVYERMVGTVKQAIRKSIGTAQLDFMQLQTLLVEIEAVVNLRPLVYVGSEFTVDNVLTPGNVLINSSLCVYR